MFRVFFLILGISWHSGGVQLRKYAAHSGITGQAPADFSESSIQAELVRNANAEPAGFLMAPQTLMTFNGGSYGHSRLPHRPR